MEDHTFSILVIVLTCIAIPSTPLLIIAVYKTSLIGTLFTVIDELKKTKADKDATDRTEDRLIKLEVKYAEFFGRLSGVLDRFEQIEKRIEDAISKIETNGKKD